VSRVFAAAAAVAVAVAVADLCVGNKEREKIKSGTVLDYHLSLLISSLCFFCLLLSSLRNLSLCFSGFARVWTTYTKVNAQN
jgi:hypothetical protein